MANKPREQFVREYAERSHLIGSAVVTDFGILGNEWARVAMPCGCGEEICEGWQMVNPAAYLDSLLPPQRTEALTSTSPSPPSDSAGR